MKTAIGAAAVLAALVVCGATFAARPPTPVDEPRVSAVELNGEVDLRLHADLARLTREAAAHASAPRHGKSMRVASR